MKWINSAVPEPVGAGIRIFDIDRLGHLRRHLTSESKRDLSRLLNQNQPFYG